MAEPDVDFWSATMTAYAPLQLSSPEFTEKLLKRPPFRFIHDVVAGINARFAAYDHILSPEQLDAGNIDTKEKKIEYLTTLINYVGKLLDRKIDVNPKKIASGHEPEKTNVFLQCLAMAVGYAQQDKARQPSASVAPPPNEDARGSADNAGDLPNPSTLPRRKSTFAHTSLAEKAKNNAIKESDALLQKITSYSLNIDVSEEKDIRVEAESIVRMWNELQNPTLETTPSQMPVEALEKAIARQLETVKQVQQLQKENDTIIQHIEQVLL